MLTSASITYLTEPTRLSGSGSTDEQRFSERYLHGHFLGSERRGALGKVEGFLALAKSGGELGGVDQQAGADAADDLALDGDTGGAYALDGGAHGKCKMLSERMQNAE